MQLDREQLAWAAGLFDGEGYVGLIQAGKGRPGIRIRIAQCHPEVLERFQTAVGGIGKLYGPYVPTNPKHSPHWQYTLNTFEHVQAAVAMLWPWLGTIKRQQAKEALEAYRSRRPDRRFKCAV